jgi:hypothetical protein
MSVNVQELYQQAVLPLPEWERLELMALIANDLARALAVNGEQQLPERKGDITKFFGAWKGEAANSSDNELIDADLARAYAAEGGSENQRPSQPH